MEGVSGPLDLYNSPTAWGGTKIINIYRWGRKLLFNYHFCLMFILFGAGALIVAVTNDHFCLMFILIYCAGIAACNVENGVCHGVSQG